jgi:hypothetical protein
LHLGEFKTKLQEKQVKERQMAAITNTAPRTQRRLHRISSAVSYLNGAVCAKTLRQWIWRRQIEVVKIGRTVCVAEDVLDRLIEQGTIPALEDEKPSQSPRNRLQPGRLKRKITTNA